VTEGCTELDGRKKGALPFPGSMISCTTIASATGNPPCQSLGHQVMLHRVTSMSSRRFTPKFSRIVSFFAAVQPVSTGACDPTGHSRLAVREKPTGGSVLHVEDSESGNVSLSHFDF
jgi:hypothetical protein